MPLQLRGKVADSIALPANYPQVHFDLANNYLVIPTAILNGYYAKPQNEYLKVLFTKSNLIDPIPDGINTYTVYELNYVEPFNEVTKYYDANGYVLDFPQKALFVADQNYYDSLNPNMVGYVPNDEVTRFSFVDANVVLGFGTQPNNTVFSGIKMACVNQKEDPFYAWDSTSSSKTTLSQPAANPAIINTFSFYDTADYDVTFLLTDYTFDYYSNTFPSEVLVHLTGFSAPFEFLNNTSIKVISNGHYTGVEFIDGEFNPPFLIEDWDTPGSKIFIGGCHYRWAKTFVDILPIFANNVWGLESIGFNIFGAILLTGEKYFYAVAQTEHSEISETIIIDTENLNEFEINTTSQLMLPLTPIKIDFGAEVQHQWTYGRIGETENYRFLQEESDLSNTTVTLTYDSQKRRWYSPPLTSNGYPFKLQIDPFNAYNIFTNVAPQVDSEDGPLESFAQVSGIYKPAFDSDDNEFFPCMNPPNINTTYNGFLNHLYLSSIPSDLNYKVKIHQQESITANNYSDSFLNWDNLYVGLPFIRITTDFDRRLKALDDYDFPAYNYYYPADRITWLSSMYKIIISQPNALNKKNKRPHAIFSIEGPFTIYQELEAQPVATNSTVTFNDDVIEDNAETLIIDGTNFELYAFDNLVTFNLGAVGFVTAATSTQLTVTFTTQPTSLGNLTAIVTTGGTFTSGAAVQVATVVAGIVVTPNSDYMAINAPTLVIAGTGFSATANQNTVTFNLGAVGTVTSATTTELTITFSTQPTADGSLTAVVAVSTSNGDSGSPVQVANVYYSTLRVTIDNGNIDYVQISNSIYNGKKFWIAGSYDGSTLSYTTSIIYWTGSEWLIAGQYGIQGNDYATNSSDTEIPPVSGWVSLSPYTTTTVSYQSLNLPNNLVNDYACVTGNAIGSQTFNGQYFRLQNQSTNTYHNILCSQRIVNAYNWSAFIQNNNDYYQKSGATVNGYYDRLTDASQPPGFWNSQDPYSGIPAPEVALGEC